jgi:rhamnosyl/mannosyltransferase
VAPRDAAAFAEAVTRLWDDPALCARFGAAAAIRARSEFTQDVMIARYRALYEIILGAVI